VLELQAPSPAARALLEVAEAAALLGGVPALVSRCQALLANFPLEVQPHFYVLLRVVNHHLLELCICCQESCTLRFHSSLLVPHALSAGVWCRDEANSHAHDLSSYKTEWLGE